MNKIFNPLIGATLLFGNLSNPGIYESQMSKKISNDVRFFNLGDSLNDNGTFVNMLRQGAGQVKGMAAKLGSPILNKLKKFDFDDNFQNNNTFSHTGQNQALIDAVSSLGITNLKPAWNFHLKAGFSLGFLRLNILDSIVDSQEFYKSNNQIDGTNYSIYGAQIIQDYTPDKNDILGQILQPLTLENQISNIIKRNLTSDDFIAINIGTSDFINQIKHKGSTGISNSWVDNLMATYEKSLEQLLSNNASKIMINGLSDLYNAPFLSASEDESIVEKKVNEFNQKLEKIVLEKQTKYQNIKIEFFDVIKHQQIFYDQINQKNIKRTNAIINNLDKLFQNPEKLLTVDKIQIKSELREGIHRSEINDFLYFDQIHFGNYYNQKMSKLYQEFITSKFN